MRLVEFARELDMVLNSDMYIVKILVSSIIDSFTGEPLVVSVAVRDITDYDNPVDVILVEHPQGQWLDTVTYINLSAFNDLRSYCVLGAENSSDMYRFILSSLRSVSPTPSFRDFVDIVREWIGEHCPLRVGKAGW